MARPKTKEELLEAATTMFTKLMKLLDSLSEEERERLFTFDLEKEKGAHWARDRNIHDVLIHLYEWHQLLLNWVNANQKGEKKQFLKEGYNWRTYGEMNVEFMEQNKDSSYEEALKKLKESHAAVMTLAEPFTDDQLFTKGVFPWVGGTTLGSYFVSATSSHYEWAVKKINKFKKSNI